MSQVLDALLKKDILQSPETVNANWESDSWDIENREAEFYVMLSYNNGTAVNMDLTLEISPDNQNWFLFAGTSKNITDASGNHLWDISGTGASFLRVNIVVNAGSIDVTKIIYSGKRRH